MDVTSESINSISPDIYGSNLFNSELTSMNKMKSIQYYSISIFFEHTRMNEVNRHFEDSEYLFLSIFNIDYYFPMSLYEDYGNYILPNWWNVDWADLDSIIPFHFIITSHP